MNIWILGARPKTLPAAIAPVLVGTALAGSQINLPRALLALVVSLALQVGVNYANDYSDGIRGTDTDRIGPVRITGSGLAQPHSVRRAALLSFAIAAMAGLALAAMTTWWLIAIGAAAIASAWNYTGGRNPYGYFALGELFVFLFFGLVATMGTFFVQTQELTFQSLIAAIPVGALACLILMVNNIRDRERDRTAGKRTLSVLLGDYRSRRLAIALLILAHLIPLALSPVTFLTTLIVSPLSFAIAQGLMRGETGVALIPYIAKTGKLHILFSTALSVGLLF